MRRFLQLHASDRLLVLQAGLLVVAVRLGLWLLPFRSLRSLLARLSRALPRRVDGEYRGIERIAWAVTTTSRYVPAASCLTQALAAHLLLCRRGLTPQLHIGVAKDQRDRLIAHAWVESEGRIVVGGTDLQRYTPLLVLKGEIS